VEALIDAIGEVTVNSEEAIVAAENAYNSLPAEDKAEVENYEILIAARATFDALFVVVELNTDNWNEYFEIKKLENWEYNDFDEPSYVEISYIICIKEEYADCIVLDSLDVVVEVYHKVMQRTFDLDLNNKTYVINYDELDPTVYEGTETYRLSTEYLNSENDSGLYVLLSIGSFTIAPDTGIHNGDLVLIQPIEDVTVSRIKGSIKVIVE
jgi:hypothetical protein